jgi:hypothetical protein
MGRGNRGQLLSQSERQKGLRGEQELANLFREAGLTVQQLQRNTDGHADLLVEGRLYVESKRQERLQLWLWLRQALVGAPRGTIPVVGFRRNRDQWYVTLRAVDLAELIGG